MIARFLESRNGATAIEYCLIAMFIGLAIVTASSALGTSVSSVFTGLAPVFR